MQINRLELLENEIKDLKDRNERLKKIRDAKLELLRLRLGYIPARFQARHPVIAYAGRTGLEGVKEGASGLGRALKILAGKPSMKRKSVYEILVANGISPKKAKKILKKSNEVSTERMSAELKRLKLINQLNKARREAYG